MAGALNLAMEQAIGRAVTIEVRDGPSPAVALAGGPVLVTATAEDSDGYAQAWDTGGRPGARVPPRQVAAYWAALVEDYLALFGRGQRPTRTVEMSTRGKVLLDLFGEAQRRGINDGVSGAVLTGLTPVQERSLRDLALSLPAAGTVATPGAALTGRWEGQMEDGGATRPLSLQFRAEGGRLAGVLTTRMGGLSIGIPLDQVTYDKGTLTFLVAVGGGTRQFQGTVQGAQLSGQMRDKAGRETFGPFSARFVE